MPMSFRRQGEGGGPREAAAGRAGSSGERTERGLSHTIHYSHQSDIYFALPMILRPHRASSLELGSRVPLSTLC